MIAQILQTLSDLQNQIEELTRKTVRSEYTGGVQRRTVADLPATASVGSLMFATDGRKTGEGAGAGTGVLCYYDGIAWRRVDDGTTVLA